MKSLFASLAFILSSTFLTAQTTQTVRGKVVDMETHQALIGAVVSIEDESSQPQGTATDVDGTFRLENVSIGKHTLKITYLGYKDQLIDITVTSAKEVLLNIYLEESVAALSEVTIVATKRGEVKNEMAVVSSRTFDVEETERYAGSRGDPARMVSSFAGVQGTDDSRNDIVVRGNSPLGVLYKVEGFDIPNPNHFAVSGSGGGPVSILNNKVLSNSDFFTSAFPAEYGNSTSAVLDLNFKNGNNEKREYSAQLGLLGTELTLEGPFSKKTGASYLVNYRYATFSIFDALNINLGTDALPKYQDINYKLSFPQKNGGVISIFGMGGTSEINIKIIPPL